ncbi:MAG: MinD/ParA family ATP-binding protein [Candidatus Hodarchaeales archaeon]
MSVNRNLKTVIVHSYKGGTGKTALSVNLAQFLAIEQKKKILLIEQDLTGPSFVNIFKFTPDYYWNDFYSVEALPFSKIVTRLEYFDVICAREGKIDIPSGEDTSRFFTRQLQRIKRQKNWLLAEGYDYVIIDTGSGFSRELVNNLIITDVAVLVTRLDTDTVTKTIYMYEKIYSQFKNRQIILVQNQVPAPVKGIVPTEVDQDVKETLEKWESFIAGKEVIDIPYSNEIAYALFISKIAPLENPFMDYIKEIVSLIK